MDSPGISDVLRKMPMLQLTDIIFNNINSKKIKDDNKQVCRIETEARH